MGYILMQPSIDKSSTPKDDKILQAGGSCLFGVSKSGAHSQPVALYHFSVIHRPAQTMMCVDRLTRRFDTLLSQYAHIVLLVSSVDCKTCSSAYTDSITGCTHVSNINPATDSE